MYPIYSLRISLNNSMILIINNIAIIINYNLSFRFNKVNGNVNKSIRLKDSFSEKGFKFSGYF